MSYHHKLKMLQRTSTRLCGSRGRTADLGEKTGLCEVTRKLQFERELALAKWMVPMPRGPARAKAAKIWAARGAEGETGRTVRKVGTTAGRTH